ncbi:MAG: NADPH:quinone oxidoreductase family protein [Actinomycetota bacterium]|nr:NADPH:quinone oxidoreductase family protein [Actinomycetota bacterium]
MPLSWVVSEHGAPSRVLRLTESPPVALGPAQVRIEVAACALGLPDVFMCRGSYPLTPPLPFTPGQELAGTVVEAGPDATTPIGARVMAFSDFVNGNGAMAELAVAEDHNVYPVPTGLDDVEAAGFLVSYLTAWIGLVDRAALRPSETVLVLGAAGGTGSAAVQLARALGATVIAVANGQAKATHCRELGADHVLDRSVEPVPEGVRALTGGRGADVVYDPVGGRAGEAAQECIASRGRFLTVGFAEGSWPHFDAHRLVLGNYSAVGVFVGVYDRTQRIAMLERMSQLVTSGHLRPAVTSVPFPELPSALDRVAAGTTLGRPVAIIDRAGPRVGPADRGA